MITAPIPANDAERLAELHALDILDTPPEERFDRLVRLCTLTFDLPIAYIAMVDTNRQWFKAQCGLTASQTGRAESFCGHAIVNDGPLIIPDAREDVRFSDNPLVLGEPHVRFYAGHPLKGPTGHNVGTLCLVDRKPRTLSDGELETFSELAALAERELNMIDLIRIQRQLIDTKNSLVEARDSLTQELAEAAEYVRSLLPPPLAEEGIRTAWKFVTSSQLGGDIFGYRRLDDHSLAFWVLDVCGHGVGASLLSITAHDTLRSQRLHGIRYDRPEEVLDGLNRAFPMEEHQNKFFTIWYGVYDTRSRLLSYGCAGHPPALAVVPDLDVPLCLGYSSLMIGAMPETPFESQTRELPRGTRLYLYSDGVFEVPSCDGCMLGLKGLSNLLTETASYDGSRVERIYSSVMEHRGSEELDDDFSLLEIDLP